MKKLNLGVIGLGARGAGLLKDILLPNEKVKVVAVCDAYQDRADAGANAVKEKYGEKPFVSADFQEIIAHPAVDAVMIFSAWESHIPIAIAAMQANKPVGMEVGGAYSIAQCWDLVRTYEETQTPIMLMENCCYGRKELLVLNMAEQDVLGEVIHCAGGYHHDLREEIAFGNENRHYRLRNYLNRNCENYPTHELGPIAKVLHINHGNRMLSLTSTASKSAGMHTYIADKKADDAELMQKTFHQGDVVTTVIRCAGGQTIVLTLDTTLPRYYSRGFTVRGTKGMYEEATDSIFLDKQDNQFDFDWTGNWGNAKNYLDKYEHPIWQQYLKEGVQGGHDGMDWLVYNAFFDSILENKPCPIDVYDTASWMCISALSEQSIQNGSMPVDIPDFTNGAWIER